MNEQAKRIQEFLASEYGISTADELIKATQADKGVNIGIFVNPDFGGKTVAKQI